MKPASFYAPHMAVGLDLNGKTNLPYGAISGGYSARYIRNTGIYTGPGYRNIADLGTNLPIDMLYGSKHAILKRLWGKSDVTIFHSIDTVSTGYNIGVALTTSGERSFFLEQGNGDLFHFNQTDSPYRIACAFNTIIINDTDVTITIGTENIDKFANSGTVYCRGNAISYTGRNTGSGTLTGVTGIQAGGHPAYSLITQTSQPSTMSTIKATCGMELEGSMLVAGVKGSEEFVRWSAPSTIDHEEYFYDFTGNGASAKQMPGPVTAMVKGINRSYIFGNKFIAATSGFDVKTGVLSTQPVTDNYGAYNPLCVVDMDGVAACLGQKRLIPININLSPNGSPATSDGVQQGTSQGSSLDETFDVPIQPWLSSFDDDQGDYAMLEYNSTEKLLTISGLVNGVLETRVFQNQKGVRAFTPTESRPSRVFCFHEGKSYFGSNSTSTVYRNHYGMTNDGVEIIHQWSTGRMQTKASGLLYDEDLTDFNYKGYMSEDCEYTLEIFINGSATPSFTQEFDDSSITSTSGIPIGTNGVGTHLLAGDSEELVYAYPFDVSPEVLGLSGNDFEVRWTCSKLGAFLQINSMIMNGQLMRLQVQNRS